MKVYLRQQLFILGCLCPGHMLVGFGLGWSAPVIPKLQDQEQTPLPNIISDGEASWVASLLYVGTIIGPHITGLLSNMIGRRPCLMLGGLLTLLSFVIVVVTRNLAMVFTGRIVMGLGIGIIFCCHFVYTGEIASKNMRGILLTAMGIYSSLGVLVIYSIGPYISYADIGYLGGALALLYGVGLFLIPETPNFMVLKGKDDEAAKILKMLGREEDISEVTTSKENLDDTERNKARWTEIFSMKSNRKALFITLTLGILQQMSGVLAVTFYATSIFDLAGSSVTPNIATIIMGITQVVASIITPFFVERSGRKVLLLVSTSVCSTSLTILGLYFLMYDRNHSAVESIGWIPLVTLIIFLVFYELGFGIIPSTFTGEMYSDNVRTSGAALTITLGWLVGFGVATAFGYMVAELGGHFVFWMFAASCALAFIFTVVFVPETKGKSLLEVQEMLSK